jgi:hypothetical protein
MSRSYRGSPHPALCALVALLTIAFGAAPAGGQAAVEVPAPLIAAAPAPIAVGLARLFDPARGAEPPGGEEEEPGG